MSDDWTGSFTPKPEPEPEEKTPPYYNPSSQAIPHWSEPKPQWDLSDEEFFRSQVAGRLALQWEKQNKKKLLFRSESDPSGKIYPLGQQLQDWINGFPNSRWWTDQQLAAAEAEVKKLRSEGKLPTSLAAFATANLPKTYREFRSKYPKEPNPRFHDSTPTPDDDCPF